MARFIPGRATNGKCLVFWQRPTLGIAIFETLDDALAAIVELHENTWWAAIIPWHLPYPKTVNEAIRDALRAAGKRHG